jgi:23S rRNA (guanosine2251-2'-O)-methyltransferase
MVVRVYGRKILKEILESNVPIRRVYFANLENPSKDFMDLVEEVHGRGIPYKFVSKKKADNLVQGEKSQGVVVDLGDFKYWALEDAIEKSADDPFIILLDQIQDPHNFGAIIRTAVGAGVDFIVIPKDRSVRVTPAVVKVSAGLVFRIPIVMVTNLSRTIEDLKDRGIWVYASDKGGTIYYETDLTGPLGLVFGNEGSGIRRLVKEKCDGVITIPMERGIDSLNVAVSAGILMYEVYRQRRMRG